MLFPDKIQSEIRAGITVTSSLDSGILSHDGQIQLATHKLLFKSEYPSRIFIYLFIGGGDTVSSLFFTQGVFLFVFVFFCASNVKFSPLL